MPITHRQSNVANKVPTAAQLVNGEIAVNVRDGRLFLKKDDGQIVSLDKEVATSVADGNARSAIYDKDGKIIGAKPGYVKLATFSCGIPFAEFAGTYSLNMNDTASEVNIIFSILLRVNDRTKNEVNNAYVSILGGAGIASMIPDNGIIVQFNTPESSSSSAYFELWVKKEVTNYGSLSLFEVSKRSPYFTTTYFRDATWSDTLNSTLPTTVYSNGLEYKDYKVFHAGNSFNDEVRPLHFDSASYNVNNLTAGQRAICFSSVLNLPDARTWVVECKKTYTNSLMQTAYIYPDNSYTASNYEFKVAYRMNKDGLGWSGWKIYEDPSRYLRKDESPYKDSVRVASNKPLGAYRYDSGTTYLEESLDAGIVGCTVANNSAFVAHNQMINYIRADAKVSYVLSVPSDYTVTIPAGTKVLSVSETGVTLSNNVTVTYTGTGTALSSLSCSIVFINTSYLPLNLDGVNVALNDRVLIKNVYAPHNGIFYLSTKGIAGVPGVGTPWVLTRTTDSYQYDHLVGATVYVEGGATQSETEWKCDINAGGTTGTADIHWNLRSNVNTGALSNAIKSVTADKLPYASGTNAFSLCDFTPLARSLVSKTVKQDFVNEINSPDYWNAGDLNDLTAGKRVNVSSSVLNIPESGKSWSVVCSRTTTGGSLIQVATRYAEGNLVYADNIDFDFARAYRIYRDSAGGWSDWYVFNYNRMSERNLLKYADYATADDEKLPCIYNPATKSLVYALPLSMSLSNLSGVTISATGSTVKITFPASLAATYRNNIFVGSQINNINGINGINAVVTSAVWSDPITPYVVEVSVSSSVKTELQKHSFMTSCYCTNAPLILGVVSSINNTENSFIITGNFSLSLIGNGARIANKDGVDLGYVTRNESGKITLERDTASPATLSNLIKSGENIQVINPDVTAPNVDLVDIQLKQRILVKDQVILANNGIFSFSKEGTASSGYVLTRTDDFNRGKLIYGSIICVINGSNGGKLFNNTLSSSAWNHAATSISFKETHTAAEKGTLTNASGSLPISSSLTQVDNVVFIPKSKVDTALNYKVVYNVYYVTTPYNNVKKTLTAPVNGVWSTKTYTFEKKIPTKVFYTVYDATTNTAVASLPAGVTIDYTIYGA